jgi:hypothetical protein
MANKKRSTIESALNALAGKIAISRPEDAARQESFISEVVQQLDAGTAAELSLARSIADARWSMERLADVENSLFYEPDSVVPALPDPKDLLLIQTFRERLQEQVSREWDALSRAQEARRAARKRDLEEAVERYNLSKMRNLHFNPETDGFGFTIAQIAASSDLKRRLWEARALHGPRSVSKDDRR